MKPAVSAMSSAWSPMRSMSVIIFSAAEISRRSPRHRLLLQQQACRHTRLYLALLLVDLLLQRAHAPGEGAVRDPCTERAVAAMASSQSAPMAYELAVQQAASCPSNLCAHISRTSP